MINSLQRPLNCNTLFLSDIHLGYKDCKADFLLDLLNQVDCKTLFLIGDIVDLWAMKSSIHWPASHQRVLQKLIQMASDGTRIVYVPGNHDSPMRDFVDSRIMDVEIHMEYTHTTADGKKLLLVHGDQFDSAVICGPLQKIIGYCSYSILLRINGINNRVRRWLRLPYWSLAYYIKNKVKNARSAIEKFERAAAAEAHKRGLDGIVCGHIHQPEMRHYGDTLYCNDGDWLESCTALVENVDGSLELLHWGDYKQAIKTEPAANDNYSLVSTLPMRSKSRELRIANK
ncbi:UDP-2,3-diacylglucosamine diphosphatase [Porticoccaceae bacterium LTM1]|nr:UDP-2,3-diacylglucosamine diphosphatase [Porticoccaceae bacterium LTM1]